MGWFSSSKKKEAPPPPPKAKGVAEMSKEELKQYQRGIKKNLRDAERDIDREIFRTTFQLKQQKKKLERMVKKGEDRSILQAHAKNVLALQKNIDRQQQHKMQVQDCGFQIDNMLVQVKMTGALQDVSGVLKTVNGMANIGAIAKISEEFQMNLAKMGVMGELVEDAMDDMDGDMDYDNETDLDALIDGIADKHTEKRYGTKLQDQDAGMDFNKQLADLKLD